MEWSGVEWSGVEWSGVERSRALKSAVLVAVELAEKVDGSVMGRGEGKGHG